MVDFSNLYRKLFVDQLRTIHFDVLVVGGGITGAGIALDAVSRGLKVALVDMQDFAAGTSSRSTKLVHGGLRYLKQLEWRLVKEVGKERTIVYHNGPHVTRPEKMLLPIYQDGTFGKITTSFGLKVYDYLAGVAKQERRKMLSAEETLHIEPLLKRDGLKGSGLYVEYRTNDARLTVEVLKKAVELGAIALNYTKVESLLYRSGKINGATVVDQISGKSYDIHAQTVVNAAGPWVDDVRRLDISTDVKTLRLTKGVHIVVDHARLPINQALYFDTPDSRMVFAIPRDNKTYIGTTDTFVDNPTQTPKMTVDDCLYLLQATSRVFPSIKLNLSDIESSWAGIRPLIYEVGKGPSEISRKDEIWQSESGLLSVAGGKLTGYRKMAENVVNILIKKTGRNNKKANWPCRTRELAISGGEDITPKNFADFVERGIRQGIELGLSANIAKELTSTYGTNINKIYAKFESYQRKSRAYQLPIDLVARLDYAIMDEMTVSPLDFFNRRTSMLFFNICEVEKNKKAVLNYMSTIFNWSEQDFKKYEQELNDAIIVATTAIEDS
ncbi:glycerol-3-phosphate dehydrogenase/oxidase [Bacillus sp. DNRA2]|uniref:glycerol-3-phosphate dehydrogenase/oxidase n=1 Tax=Bacillus sp. DNRA2 TaxID=2723053 RepID=UPI00145EE636|nr:glycerol-3-phosphate dehydrogenase/oxidase [Bacillus sp. DNRA2]NMD69976.1 glycerol-3-phosphate dehydrogenase/oxidase [Bacillus sp. DNRA2]